MVCIQQPRPPPRRLGSLRPWHASSPSTPARPGSGPWRSTSRGRVIDLAYRELTQHFPRPGWVEHDPAEIWDAVRATLAEVAGRLAGAGTAVAALGHHQPTGDGGGLGPRTGRPLAPAIVWQDRRTADHCDRARATPGTCRSSGPGPAWCSIRTSRPPSTPGCSPTGGLGRPAPSPRPGPRHGRLVGAVAPDRRAPERRGLRHRPHQRLSDAPLRHRPARAGRTSCATSSACRAEPWPRSGRRAAGSAPSTPTPSAARRRAAGARRGAGQRRSPATSRPPCSARPASSRAWPRSPTAPAASCWSTPARLVRRPPDGLLVTVAWDLGSTAGRRSGRLRAGGFDVRVRARPVQWLRDGLGLIERADELGPLAESVADSGGVIVVPAFTGLGSPWWDPRARGIVTGITRGAGRPQLARAVVEAMAFQVRDMLDAMTEATGQPCRQLRADGGAAAMDLLLQLQADQLQRRRCVRPRSSSRRRSGRRRWPAWPRGCGGRWTTSPPCGSPTSRTRPPARPTSWPTSPTPAGCGRWNGRGAGPD